MTQYRPTNIDMVECYQQIFNDWLTIHPEDRSETVRDHKRIALEYRSRGLSFFTIDLPAIAKYLYKAIDEERISPKGLPHTRGFSKGTSIPRLFRGFWLRIFGIDGRLREDADPDAIAYLSTLYVLFKKLDVPCAPKYVTKTIQEFIRDDEALPAPSEAWNSGFSGTSRAGLGHLLDFGRIAVPDNPESPILLGGHSDDFDLLSTCQRVADELSAELSYLEDSEILPKHGPGKVGDKPLGDYKYNFPSWSPSLEVLLPYHVWGTHSLDAFLVRSEPLLHPPLVEGISRLAAVPKTQTAPRLIASEPTCNQWIQQGVSNALRKKVARSRLGRCIDFFDQLPSQLGALEASRNGKRATVDLRSASDRLSCALVQRVFRSNFRLLELMYASRTRFTDIPPSLVKTDQLATLQPGKLSGGRVDTGRRVERDSFRVKLNKYASMGSALTFPVQSIVFAILAIGYGSFHTRRSVSHCSGLVRVFGDDIIIPSEWVEGFSRLLRTLFLNVNSAKTFSHGKFRESCGMHAFRGFDVTPGYINSPSSALNTRSALGYFDSVNNLFLKGYWHLSSYLEKTAQWGGKLPVVNCRSRAYGWVSFCSGLDPKLAKRVRKHPDYHYDAIRVPRLLNRGARASFVESSNALAEFFFQSRKEVPPLINCRDSSELQRVIKDASKNLPIIRQGWVDVATLVGNQGG